MGMDIRLARIDDRLIHGQVATVWSKQTAINRILVVSDEVASDPLRRFLLTEAAPPGINVNVLTVEKMIQLFFSELLAHEKVMLLFTRPQDVAALVRNGVALHKVNIGGMRFIAGKRMITNFISVDERDIQTFYYLANQGITLEVRKVPSDRQVNLIELLDKDKTKSSLQ